MLLPELSFKSIIQTRQSRFFLASKVKNNQLTEIRIDRLLTNNAET